MDRRSGENNRTWNVDVKCLICDALIESATDTDNKSTTAATIEVTAAKAAQANEKVGGPAEIDQKPNGETAPTQLPYDPTKNL